MARRYEIISTYDSQVEHKCSTLKEVFDILKKGNLYHGKTIVEYVNGKRFKQMFSSILLDGFYYNNVPKTLSQAIKKVEEKSKVKIIKRRKKKQYGNFYF